MTGRAFPARRRKSPARSAAGCALVLAGLFLFTSAMELFWTRVDERRFPWAYEGSGQLTLTGTWVGTLATGGGARRGVYLDLRLEPLDFEGRTKRMYRRDRSSKLEGDARLCAGAGREQRFTFTGNNADDAAARFHLGLRVADSVPPDGLAPSHMRGRWNGRDSLALEADVYLRRGASAISSTDDPHTGPPATVGLHRGGEAEYRTLCARLPKSR